MARAFSRRVFDRPLGAGPCSHGIAGDLEILAGHERVERRALGANVECDWRVSAEQQQRFCDTFEGLTEEERPKDLKQKLHHFFDKRVQGVAIPDFLLPANTANRLNAMNRNTTVFANVFRLPTTPQIVQAGADSVNLGALFRREEARAVIEAVFPPGPFGHRSTDQGVILDDRQRKFLSACLGRGTKPNRHPVWAGLWNEFAPFIEQGPDCWLSAFGMRSEKAHLCLLFRYRLEVLGGSPVFRPTYLESRCYDEHFPSPAPRCAWREGEEGGPRGGHPMSLRVETDLGPILQEFLHQDFARDPDMIFAWGWPEAKNPAKSIELARQDHFSRLGNYYSNLNSWLEEPI